MRVKTVRNDTDKDVEIWELQGKRLVLPPGASASDVTVTNPQCLAGCTFLPDLTEVRGPSGKQLLHD